MYLLKEKCSQYMKLKNQVYKQCAEHDLKVNMYNIHVEALNFKVGDQGK